MKTWARQQTTEKLLELCYWVEDRRRYCEKCGKKQNPEDTLYRYAAEDELTRRGVAFPLFFTAAAV